MSWLYFSMNVFYFSLILQRSFFSSRCRSCCDPNERSFKGRYVQVAGQQGKRICGLLSLKFVNFSFNCTTQSLKILENHAKSQNRDRGTLTMFDQYQFEVEEINYWCSPGSDTSGRWARLQSAADLLDAINDRKKHCMQLIASIKHATESTVKPSSSSRAITLGVLQRNVVPQSLVLGSDADPLVVIPENRSTATLLPDQSPVPSALRVKRQATTDHIDDIMDSDDVPDVTKKSPTKKAKTIDNTAQPASSCRSQPDSKVQGIVDKILTVLTEFDVLGLPNPQRDLVSKLAGYKNRNSTTSKTAFKHLFENKYIQYPTPQIVCLTNLGRCQRTVVCPCTSDEQCARIKSLLRSIESSEKISGNVVVRLFDFFLNKNRKTRDHQELHEKQVIAKHLGYNNPASAAPKQAFKCLLTLGAISSPKSNFFKLNTTILSPASPKVKGRR